MGVAAEAAPRIGSASARPNRGPDGIVVALFALTALMGSGLLFAVEPMIAKMLSPTYGGSPMVWSTSVLFFQVALLAGHAYVHWAQRLLSTRSQLLVQIPLVVAPFFVLPFSLPTWSGMAGLTSPTLWVLLTLTTVVGAPLAVLSAAGLLVQRWYSSSGLPRAKDPYFLYAVGSIGGLLALLAYPFVIEPAVDLATQVHWWMITYGVFAALAVVCGLVGRFRAARVPTEAPIERETVPAERISWARRARWLTLAFIPSSLMLGVTTRMSIHIAAIPLVWVVPFALCVATFIVAFGLRAERWVTPVVTAAAISAAVIPWLLYFQHALVTDTLLCLSLILAAGLACHGLLARDRPTPGRWTEFFLIISLGGALGSVFNSVLTPIIFNWSAELPLVATALAVLPLVRHPQPDANTERRFSGTLIKAFVLTGPLLAAVVYLGFGISGLIVAIVAALLPWCALAVPRPHLMAVGAALTTAGLFWYQGFQSLEGSSRQRTFFGDYEIYSQRDWVVLSDGTTMRGYQYPTAPTRTMPVSYYGRPGPFGDLFAGYGDRSSRIAVVGLGTGTEASYGRPGQQLDFYEPDPAALNIALTRFAYLNDSKAGVSTILGDGRLRLEKAPDSWYGMIVLDAFNSDAVPTHLLTREALQMYVRKLRPGGVLAFHVTARKNVDLAPMLRATAQSAGLASITGYGFADPKLIYQPSTWVAVARSDTDLQPLRNKAERWRMLQADGPVWTDTHASLIGVLKFG